MRNIRLCVVLKSEFLISKKHLKPRKERNRDNLFNVINYILANQVTIMKKNFSEQGFPNCVVCRKRNKNVPRNFRVFDRKPKSQWWILLEAN